MDAVRCKHLHPTKRQSVNRLVECHSFVALGSCQHFVVPLSFATSVPCAFLSGRRFSGCSRFGGYFESHPFMRCASGIAHQKFSHMSNAQLHPSPKHVAVAVSKGSQGNLLGEASLLHPLFPTTSSSSSSSSSSIESMDGIDSTDYAPYVQPAPQTRCVPGCRGPHQYAPTCLFFFFSSLRSTEHTFHSHPFFCLRFRFLSLTRYLIDFAKPGKRRVVVSF